MNDRSDFGQSPDIEELKLGRDEFEEYCQRYRPTRLSSSVVSKYLEESALPDNFESVILDVGPIGKQAVIDNFEILKKKVHENCQLDFSWKNDPYSRLFVLVPKKSKDKLFAFIDEEVQPLVERFTRSTLEVDVSGANYKVHLGLGGEPIELIFPDEFCSVFVGDALIWWEKQNKHFIDYFDNKFFSLGATDVVKFGYLSQKLTGFSSLVRLKNKESAVDLLRRMEESHYKKKMHCEPRRYIPLNREPLYLRMTRYELHLTWWRRPSKGIVSFELQAANQKLRDLSVRLLQGCGFDCCEEQSREPSVSLEYVIVARNVDKSLTKENIYVKVVNLLNRHGIGVKDIFVPRGKSYEPESAVCLKRFADRITRYTKQAMKRHNLISQKPQSVSLAMSKDGEMSNLPFTVEVQPVRNAADFQMCAAIIFNSFEDFSKITAAFYNEMTRYIPLSMGHENNMQTVELKKFIRFASVVSTPLYETLVQDLIGMKMHLEATFSKDHVSLGQESIHYNKKLVYVQGDDYKQLLIAKSELDHLIDGKFIGCSNTSEKCDLLHEILLNNDGQKFLTTLQARANGTLIITSHFFKQLIQLQGTSSSIKSAEQLIENFLRERKVRKWPFSILVAPPKYANGTLTAFMDLVGHDAENVRIMPNRQIRIQPNFDRCELYISGSKEEYQQILEMLSVISEGIGKETNSQRQDRIPPQCSICLNLVELNWFCFENCGHYSCKTCFLHQVQSLIKMKDFPMKCAKCCKPVAVNDIVEALLDGYTKEPHGASKQLQILVDAAVSCFISRNLSKYHYCRTPNCCGIVKLTEKEDLACCSVCNAVYCTRCGNEEHPQMNCELYGKLKSDVDSSLRHWMEQDPDNRQVCPNSVCSAIIEKQQGCNHMQCEYCKIHFCWVCFMTAPSSGEIYKHLNEIHGGNGSDFRDFDLGNPYPDIRDPVPLQVQFHEDQNQEVIHTLNRREDEADQSFDHLFRIIDEQYIQVFEEEVYSAIEEEEFEKEEVSLSNKLCHLRLLDEDFDFKSRLNMELKLHLDS